MSYDFEDSADRIAGAQNLVDFFFHALLGIGIGAGEQDLVLGSQRFDLFPGNFSIGNRHCTHGNHVAQNFNAEFAQ